MKTRKKHLYVIHGGKVTKVIWYILENKKKTQKEVQRLQNKFPDYDFYIEHWTKTEDDDCYIQSYE